MLLHTPDICSKEEWDTTLLRAQTIPLNCTTAKICHICNEEESIELEREIFDEDENELRLSRKENRTDQDKYIKDTTEQGQLLAAVFKESAILSIRRLRKLQIMDDNIVPIMRRLTKNETGWEERFCIKDGILLEKKKDEIGNDHWVIVVPAALAPGLLHDMHASIYGFGHPSAEKLQKIATQKFSIQNLRSLCTQIVNNCSSCLMFKCNTKLPRIEGQIIKPRGANQVVHLDFVTMQNIETNYTHPEYGQILVMVDAFTLYSVAIPCKAHLTAAETFQIFLLHWVAPFGPPKKGILCDNAKQFCCELTNLCTNLIGIRLLYIAPHKHSGNLAERIHRTLLTNIRCAKNNLNFAPSNWPILLALAVHSHNNSKQVRTGMSPIYAFLGREAHFQINNFVHLDIVDSFDEFPKNLAKAQEHLSRLMDVEKNKWWQKQI